MSWSVPSSDPVAKQDLRRLFPEAEATGPAADGHDDAKAHQLEAAKAAAVILAMAVGRPDDFVIVAATGHANPGHNPVGREGFEAITVTVMVGQAPEPPVIVESQELTVGDEDDEPVLVAF